MSHCISVYLLRKEELRDMKINSVIENSSYNNLKFKELNCNIIAITDIDNIKEFIKDKTIAKIETDYFGGSGSQTAKIFINSKKVYDKSSNDWTSEPINDVLKQLGVKKGMFDEFDTVGLGNYRKNSDFNKN